MITCKLYVYIYFIMVIIMIRIFPWKIIIFILFYLYSNFGEGLQRLFYAHREFVENDFTWKRGARGDHLAKGPNTDCKVILSHAHERRGDEREFGFSMPFGVSFSMSSLTYWWVPLLINFTSMWVWHTECHKESDLEERRGGQKVLEAKTSVSIFRKLGFLCLNAVLFFVH